MTGTLGFQCFRRTRVSKQARLILFSVIFIVCLYWLLFKAETKDPIVVPKLVQEISNNATMSCNRESTEKYCLNFSFIIDGKSICHNGIDPTPIVMFLIMSEWKTKAVRDGIRNTWASGNYVDKFQTKESNYHSWRQLFKIAFLIGLPRNIGERQRGVYAMTTENKLHNDIVVIDFEDSYFNLTLKVLTGFRWASKYCPEAKYVAKSDHDVFIHVPRFVELITDPRWDSSIVGPLHPKGEAPVERKGKFGVAKSAYQPNFYPAHVKGNIYSMPLKVAESIVSVATSTPYVNMEDVYVTGILGELVKATYKGFTVQQYNQRAFQPDACDFIIRNKIAGQNVSSVHAMRIWKGLKAPFGAKC